MANLAQGVLWNAKILMGVKNCNAFVEHRLADRVAGLLLFFVNFGTPAISCNDIHKSFTDALDFHT